MNIFEVVRGIPLHDVIRRYSPNSPITKYGKTWLLCPFHNDRNPSLSLKGQRWKCFGCQEGGDSVDFVTRLYNLSLLEAARMIAADFGLSVDEGKPLTSKQRAEIRQRQDKRILEVAWKDGVNVLYRMAYTSRDALLRVVIPDNIEGEVIAVLVSLVSLINALETGDRGKILTLLNGGATTWN